MDLKELEQIIRVVRTMIDLDKRDEKLRQKQGVDLATVVLLAFVAWAVIFKLIIVFHLR